MKKFTENRPVAWAVLAVVIIGTLLLGGGGALKSRADAVTALFTDPDDSISYELKQMADSAELMTSIVQSADGADMAQVAAVTDAIDTLRTAASVKDKYAGSVALYTAAENLYSGASKLELSDKDQSELDASYKNYSSAYLSLNEYGEYNEAVEAFNKVRSGFPAGLIGALRGIPAAEKFGK